MVVKISRADVFNDCSEITLRAARPSVRGS